MECSWNCPLHRLHSLKHPPILTQSYPPTLMVQRPSLVLLRPVVARRALHVLEEWFRKRKIKVNKTNVTCNSITLRIGVSPTSTKFHPCMRTNYQCLELYFVCRIIWNLVRFKRIEVTNFHGVYLENTREISLQNKRHRLQLSQPI